MAHTTDNYKIFTELSDFKRNYETISLEKIDGLKRSQYKVIKMVEYYTDSQYMGSNYGNKNASGRPVPFLNIVNYRVTLAKTATDLDIKDFNIVSDNPNHQTESMLLNREVYELLKEMEFSKTLNDMGTTRPKYGGYLVEKIEEKGDLKIPVLKWTNVYTNQNNILGGPIVKCRPMSPVEINKKAKVWDNVRDVLEAWNKLSLEDRPSEIDVYEITGEFPISVYRDAINEESTDEEEYTYSLQRYVTAEVGGKKFNLFCTELSGEMEDYFEYLSWEDNGYGLGRGVVEEAEEAQVWTNDSVINETIAMNLGGRAGIITDSKKLGNNILEHDHGKVYQIESGKMAQPFNLAPSALGHYQNMRMTWKSQADDAVSSYNAATGEQPPSGTPYSQTALLNQVATKPFDYKREEWGIHLTKIFNKWIIPHAIKRLKKKHILVSEFSEDELQMIDDSFANYNSNEDLKKAVLNRDYEAVNAQGDLIEGYKKHIKKTGKKRFIEIPDGYFDDFEGYLTIQTTNEQKDKAVILQSMNTLLGEIVQFYQMGIITDTKFLEQILREIIENSGAGISPASMGKFNAMVKAVDQAPQSPVVSPQMSPIESQPVTA